MPRAIFAQPSTGSGSVSVAEIRYVEAIRGAVGGRPFSVWLDDAGLLQRRHHLVGQQAEAAHGPVRAG